MIEHALITGGTGFIGQALAHTLRREGIPVRVLARPSSLAAKAQVVERLCGAGVDLAVGEVQDAGAVRAATAGVSHVFHLAGQLQEPGITPETYQAVHVEGTCNVLVAAAEQVRRPLIVHCSTAGVLGPTGPAPVPETAPLRPSNVYEVTKASGELLARHLAELWGVRLAVVRPSLVYGPGDLHLLGWFRSIARGYYRVVGSGQNLVHPIYIDDVVTGLRRCAEDPRAQGQVYHLVGQGPLPMRALASRIAEAVGRRLPRLHIPAPLARCVAAALAAVPGLEPARLPLTPSRVSFMTESRVYCGARISEDLRFEPKVDLGAGLQRTAEWYRREHLL